MTVQLFGRFECQYHQTLTACHFEHIPLTSLLKGLFLSRSNHCTKIGSYQTIRNWADNTLFSNTLTFTDYILWLENQLGQTDHLGHVTTVPSLVTFRKQFNEQHINVRSPIWPYTLASIVTNNMNQLLLKVNKRLIHRP